MKSAVSSTWDKKTLEYQCGQETSWPSSISTESYLGGLRETESLSQQCLVHTEHQEECQLVRRRDYSSLHNTHETLSRGCV